jgi:hypothetical protein
LLLLPLPLLLLLLLLLLLRGGLRPPITGGRDRRLSVNCARDGASRGRTGRQAHRETPRRTRCEEFAKETPPISDGRRVPESHVQGRLKRAEELPRLGAHDLRREHRRRRVCIVTQLHERRVQVAD